MVKSWIFREKDDAGSWIDHPESDLPDEPVLIDVVHSAVNYKDALSLTRSAPISRRFPIPAWRPRPSAPPPGSAGRRRLARRPLGDMVIEHKFEAAAELARNLLASKSKGRIVLSR